VRRLVHVHIHICDMTHGCMWHHDSLFMTWCIDVCDIDGSNIWQDHWCTWHDSFILIGVCDNTHSYIGHDAFMYLTLPKAAKEISLKSWQPLSTRLGDLVPLKRLLFRDLRKPLTNSGVSMKNFPILCHFYDDISTFWKREKLLPLKGRLKTKTSGGHQSWQTQL